MTDFRKLLEPAMARGGKTGATRRARRARCPICGAVVRQDHRPFCSKRCADADLSRWLSGSYRIPTDERPDAADAAADAEQAAEEDE